MPVKFTLDWWNFKLTVFELTMHFKHENDRNLAKISQKLRIKWNFELTVFELTVPDLYDFNCFTEQKYFFSFFSLFHHKREPTSFHFSFRGKLRYPWVVQYIIWHVLRNPGCVQDMGQVHNLHLCTGWIQFKVLTTLLVTILSFL